MKENKELELYQNKLVQFLSKEFVSTYKIDRIEVSRDKYAEKSGIAQGTLSRIKKGEGYDVPISTIYKICKFENVSIKDFFIKFEKFLEKKESESVSQPAQE